MKEQTFERNEIVIETNIFRLHKFESSCEDNETPILVIPPHAGRSGNIAQNIIDKCTEYRSSVYAYELLSATNKTRDTSIHDLVEAIATCQKYIDKPVDLVCLCQGAWVGAIYTSLYQDTVNRYANFAGPINTKTGEDNVIEKYCETANIDDQKNVVSISGGIQPGLMQWLAFSMVDPSVVYLKRWFDLWNLTISGDSEGLAKWEKNNSWYDTPYDLAGIWFLDCLENHFIKNKLYRGEWEVNGETIELPNITCPVYLYGGENDQITHWRQVFDMDNVVSGEVVIKRVFEGAGHTKCFCGKRELEIFVEDFFEIGGD